MIILGFAKASVYQFIYVINKINHTKFILENITDKTGKMIETEDPLTSLGTSQISESSFIWSTQMHSNTFLSRSRTGRDFHLLPVILETNIYFEITRT